MSGVCVNGERTLEVGHYHKTLRRQGSLSMSILQKQYEGRKCGLTEMTDSVNRERPLIGQSQSSLRE